MENGIRRAVTLLLACLLVSVPIAAGGNPTDEQRVAEIDSDDVALQVDVRADGSAAWAIEHRVELDDEETTQAFEDLQRDVAENRSAYVDRFERRIGRTVRSAENRTGRGMAVRNVSVTAEKRALPQEYGVLTYRFEWDGFAVADEERITAGDALAGFFLDSETRLLITWPSGYEIGEVEPEPDESRDRRAVWIGPTDFGTDEPRIVVESAAETGGEGTEVQPDEGAFSGVLLAGAILAIAICSAVAWWRVRSGVEDGSESGEPTESIEPSTCADLDEGRGGSVEYDENNERDGRATPSELLSNGEQVLRLLEDNDGRIKQQEVVQTLGWTDAKTSQIVGKLRDEDEIESFRLGRENVLVLPDAAEEDRI